MVHFARKGKRRDTAIVRHAVQRLAPPIVVQHIQPWNRAGLVYQLRNLFFHRYAVDPISRTLLSGQRSIQICWFFRILCAETTEDENKHNEGRVDES